MANYLKPKMSSVFKTPKASKLKFQKIAKAKIAEPKIKAMEQYTGPRTTGTSQMEGRLKMSVSKRKIAKAAIKKAKKPASGMKRVVSMM